MASRPQTSALRPVKNQKTPPVLKKTREIARNITAPPNSVPQPNLRHFSNPSGFGLSSIASGYLIP